MTVIGAAAQAVVATGQGVSSVGPGSWGFWVVIFMLIALVLLYRSMRRQIRKVDFDAEGATDEERMRGRHHADE